METMQKPKKKKNNDMHQNEAKRSPREYGLSCTRYVCILEQNVHINISWYFTEAIVRSGYVHVQDIYRVRICPET